MENLQKEIESLLNGFSEENKSNTPDFVLASYLIDCLDSFNKAVNRRGEWHGQDREVIAPDNVTGETND